MMKLRLLATVLVIGAGAAGPAVAQGGQGGSARPVVDNGYTSSSDSAGAPVGDDASKTGGTPAQQPGDGTATPAPTQDGIQQLQGQLQRSGFYNGDIDGIWGPQTSKAVQDFQQARGLQPTGKLNTETVQALGQADDQSGGNNQNAANQGSGQGVIRYKQGVRSNPTNNRFTGNNRRPPSGANTSARNSSASPGPYGYSGDPGYAGGNVTSVNPSTSVTGNGATTGVPSGYFGLSTNLSNGYNAARGR